MGLARQHNISKWNKNPDKFITKRKNKSLNALMRGKDKIKLEPDFANFIIQKVNKINNKL